MPYTLKPPTHAEPAKPLSIEAESKRDRYDVIVVGAGIGGLSAAALLAKAGRSVLVIERHRHPGGCAHGFSRKKFKFDSGVHLVSGCGPAGYGNGRVVYRVMEALGIAAGSPFIAVSPYAKVSFPNLTIELRSGEDAFVATLADDWPEHRDALLRLSRLCRSIAEELMLAEEALEHAASKGISPASALPNLLRYRRATLGNVMDEFIPEPRLQSAYASLWPYLGLPPSKLSFLAWATMCAGYVYEGGYYCTGTFQRYANMLSRSLENSGGELLLNSSVRRITVQQGKAVGVMLDNNQIIRAEAIISNADMRQTGELLIGKENLPKGYWEGLERLMPSLSVFVTYLATDLPLETRPHAHEWFHFESLDHELTHARTQGGAPNWFTVTVPTLADPSLAPAGQHLVMLTQLCPFQAGKSWRSEKSGQERKLLNRAERVFPGLNDHLLFVESGSPRTVERYTLNFQGAAYGWAPTPDQIGGRRPSVRGPVPGLFFAGHWTRPGGGITGVSYSGVLAAQAVLGIKSLNEFWGRFDTTPNADLPISSVL